MQTEEAFTSMVNVSLHIPSTSPNLVNVISDILGNNASDEPGEPNLLNFDSLPPPQLLEPDWGWLGAARILVEANMKDLEIDGLHRFTSLDSWREQGWVESSTNVSTSWDWAGVEGIWRYASPVSLAGWDPSADAILRRCVCWIGYSRLIRALICCIFTYLAHSRSTHCRRKCGS